MDLKGKKVLIFQQRGWAINIGHFLAKKLQEEGCKLAALRMKRTTNKFVVNQKDVKYSLIIDNDKIMGEPDEYLDGDSYSLKKICNELNIDTIWPLVNTVRNYVKSYGDKYYYGFKQNTTDKVIVDYIMAIYKFIKIIFNDFQPDIIITPNIISLPHIMINLYAKNIGIKMIAVTDSKIKGYYIFSHHYQDKDSAFYDRVDALNNNQIESKNIEKAKEYIREFRETFKNPDYVVKNKKKLTLIKKIRFELSPYKQVLRWYIKGPSKNYLKSMGITLDYKPPKIILRDHYCHKINKRFVENFKYHSFEKVKKFVYFPLQFQPEATIDVMAPYFCNQIETVRQVAMSMPDDYVLIVKEHPGMIGLRSPSYTEKIVRTPNVKLIDSRISSEKVLKRAALIISPSSTTIAEAAFLKKPAIQLGDLGTTQKLPNVFRHTNMTTLPKKIKEVLMMNLETKEYEKKLENFVSAVYDTGFDFKYMTVWEKGKGDSMENLWKIYKKEIINNIK